MAAARSAANTEVPADDDESVLLGPDVVVVVEVTEMTAEEEVVDGGSLVSIDRGLGATSRDKLRMADIDCDWGVG